MDSGLRWSFVLFFLFFAISCTRPTPAPVTLLGTQTSENNNGHYRVSRDETVYSIAKTTGVSMQALIDLNRLSPPYTILAGQKLDLPKPATYTVRYNDTVYAISRALNVSQSEIVSENNLKAPEYRVEVGQLLKIPSGYSPNQRSIFDDSISVEYEPAQSWKSASNNGNAIVQSEELEPPPKPNKKPLLEEHNNQSAVVARKIEPKQSIIAQPEKRSSSKFTWPVQGNVLSSYGTKKGGQHNDGINIGATRGTPVRAAENGVVAYSGNEIEGYGNLLLIRHSDGYMTAYAHLDKVLVSRGDKIGRGQTVAAVGSTGNVTTPQLHFEIRRGSDALNPTTYLN